MCRKLVAGAALGTPAFRHMREVRHPFEGVVGHVGSEDVERVVGAAGIGAHLAGDAPYPITHQPHADADTYAETMRRDGAVIAAFAERKAEIARQLAAAAAKGLTAPVTQALADLIRMGEPG